MSDSLFEEYKAYYKLRANRYKDRPNYKHSYAAELDLSEAMQGCEQLGDFRHRIGNKNIICGVALIQDKYGMRKQHYTEMQETIRLDVVNTVLETVLQVETAMDLATIVSTAETKGGVKISMDESNRVFHDEWDRIDLIEIYENAEIPFFYRRKVRKWADEERQKLNEKINTLESNNHHWQPGWKHTPGIVLEFRHKRLLPYSDKHIQEQLDKYRKIIKR